MVSAGDSAGDSAAGASSGGTDSPEGGVSDGGARFRRALFSQTPRVWVTPALVLVNVAVFVAMVASGVSPLSPTVESLLRWGANHAPRTLGGEWWRLLTNTFVHIGVIHIAMNMIGLWQIGALVERLLGHRSFLLIYLISGLCGSLASTLWHPQVVSAGASGAVFGVYGVLIAYLVRHRGSIPREVLSQLQRSTAIFIGLNVLFGLRQPGIDMAAHIGGLVAGFAAALIAARPLTGRAPAGRDILVAGLALALVGGTLALAPRPLDLQKEMNDFASVERRAVDAFNGALERRRADGISDAELASVVERDVLAPWRAQRQRLLALGPLPSSPAVQLRDIQQYMELRERGWAAFTEALRTGDEEKAHQSRMFQEQADALMKSKGVAPERQ